MYGSKVAATKLEKKYSSKKAKLPIVEWHLGQKRREQRRLAVGSTCTLATIRKTKIIPKPAMTQKEGGS